MTLKAKMILSIIIACVLTAGVLALLTLAYLNNFTVVWVLSLLGGTLIMMVFWCYYYIALTKYQESLNPGKKKYIKKGNRKESRKSVNRIK
ncbi:MAG: hypothetical protein FWE60_03900 [Oscillospiraceae bacterium]|nr:hypothetical protein [Oscillospiraceae bacterium]